jgi:predicted small metal-binding protein
MRRRALLCASLCNCRHALRADDNEGLVQAALEHLERNHPSAPVGQERVWEIVFSHAYDIEFAKAYVDGSFGPDEEFGPEPY